jgi:diadenosine tetraphosphate (Ap4A) HIT family hydrolase
MNVTGCLGCDLQAGRRSLPGGFLYKTSYWVVNHVVGPMSLGTLAVSPREHVTAVAELDDGAAAELGAVLRASARVVEQICQPEQTYVCLWSHGPGVRKHLHFVVQPVTTAVVSRYGGLRSEQLQARMTASGDEAALPDIERFCDQAREQFTTSGNDRQRWA